MDTYPTPEEYGQRIHSLQSRVGSLAMALEEYRAELTRAMGAVTEVMATRADLDDLRLEVKEATATPFNTEA